MCSKKLKTTTQGKKRTLMFDDIIADIISNKNLHPAVSRLFFRSSKLNICLAFITQ